MARKFAALAAMAGDDLAGCAGDLEDHRATQTATLHDARRWQGMDGGKGITAAALDWLQGDRRVRGNDAPKADRLRFDPASARSSLPCGLSSLVPARKDRKGVTSDGFGFFEKPL